MGDLSLSDIVQIVGIGGPILGVGLSIVVRLTKLIVAVNAHEAALNAESTQRKELETKVDLNTRDIAATARDTTACAATLERVTKLMDGLEERTRVVERVQAVNEGRQAAGQRP